MADKSIDEMTDDEILASDPPEIKEQEDEASKEQEPVNTEEPVDEDDSSGSEPEDGEKSSEEEGEETEEEESTEPEQPAVDYKAFYDAMMSPMKANGKEFRARNPQEAIRLMQMGANYTHKMQTLAPYRKKIQMLQNAGLLEDEKLNYLIDIAKGNPQAITKLIKDSKIDPLDLNVSDEPNYVPGNHTVSDNEVQVQAIVDDLKSTPDGQETLKLVQGWDQASLNTIWQTPSIMSTLHEQRQNGVYKLITDEMEHQRLLGNIPENTSFLDAYKAVGDYLLQQRDAQRRYAAQLPKGTLNRQVPNNEQVKRAAPTGRSKKSAQTFVDPFSLSDEEFEKQFKNYAI